MNTNLLILGTAIFLIGSPTGLVAGAAPGKLPVRGSIIEDRAARKLIQAGDLRYDAGEEDKAVEIWQSVIERYPRSKVRYTAHLKLGEHFLTRKNAYDKEWPPDNMPKDQICSCYPFRINIRNRYWIQYSESIC